MRYIIPIVIFFSFGCASDRPISNAGSNDCVKFRRMATHCLRDWLTGEDGGGTWDQVGTTPEDLSGLLIGENPCIEWNGRACGQYTLRYIVGDACCRDTSYVTPLKCCLTGSSNCNN